MAIIKPTKPDSELPKTWGGTQYPYTEEQIAEGLPEAIPTIIDGGTLNYEKKGVFERMEYVTQVSDAVAGAPIKKTLITNANNQFEYAGIGVYSYSATQTYALDDYVIYSTNEGTKIYKSLSNNNIGKELTNETYWEELSLGGGSGLEIGDIGIAPFGIDESQNKRRYLNGQVISQAQFVSFTNKVKAAIQLTPNLATSETNWQAEVTNSKLGQCGKFVIDDTLGTIRLPKVVNINGLADLSLMGSIKAESLPNITGKANIGRDSGMPWQVTETEGALYNGQDRGGVSENQSYASGASSLRIDASRSSSTYQDNAPVQQEAIQYPYFIQVATGVEEAVDVTREIELNNPFSLLDYKWSEYELNNASWLLSNGAFHSGTVYKSVYELLLKIHNGTETKEGVSVKLSTEAYTDTDFVINTADTTFRLPIKVKLASGNAIVGNGKALMLTNGTETGALSACGSGATGNVAGFLRPVNGADGINIGDTAETTLASLFATDKAIGITTDPTKSGIETSSSGLKLYFYVGETIQDANVINASGVLTRVAELSDEYITSLLMPDYSAGVSIASLPYTAQNNGFASVKINRPDLSATIYVNGVHVASHGLPNQSNAALSFIFPISKGDIITTNQTINYGVFFPLKGAN